MATRSFIARYNTDTNDFTAIYCHWDGYPEGVGVTLRDHYNTDEKVNFLIGIGDISSLRDTFDETKEESYKDSGYTAVDAKLFATFTETLEHYRGMWCEYGYVWKDHRWECYELGPKEVDLYAIKEMQNV